MKNAVKVILAAFLLLCGTSALADNNWHMVLSCDGGAAVLDNITVYGRGGAGLGAQLVIRNPQIVYYFLQSHAGGEFVDGQWIGQSYFEPFQGGQPNEVLLNFSSESAVVQSNGQTLTVTTGGANWTFRNCTRL
ncbi:MAG: hypothetical protein ACXVCP_18815 [Bdellovibrio sp.]